MNASRLRRDSLIAVDEMCGEDSEETAALHRMLAKAEAYVRSFPWCPHVTERYFGCGVPDLVAAFLFRFERPISETDEWLWVIEGDVPSAYLVVDEAPDGREALTRYCEMMDEWIKRVRDGQSLANVFPVDAPSDKEHAEMLSPRIRFIREQILPNCCQ